MWQEGQEGDQRPIISPARCTVHYRVGIVRSVINVNGEFSRYREGVSTV